MQDRFKFRFYYKPLEQLLYPENYLDFDEYINNDNCILMQCTGLKDNQGKLIYEGDIIYKKGSKNYKKEKMYSRVCWDSMYAQFNISDENGMHQMPSNSNNIEIVGNIYNNPELLEEVK